MALFRGLRPTKILRARSAAMCPLTGAPFEPSVIKSIYQVTDDFFVKQQKKTKCADTSESISSLINIPLSQSQCIRLGTIVEKILRLFLDSHAGITDIRPTNKKGMKERDHLFIADGEKIYAELKCNLNLDTEKRKKTCKKVNDISIEESCDGYLLAVRYLNELPEKIMKSYNSVNIISISDYFRLFNIPCPFGSDLEFKIWLNQMARKLVSQDQEELHDRIEQMEKDLIELKRLKK